MTILGILFVLGVAFLSSMNFEADLLAFETQRHRAESRVTAVVDQLGSTLRDGLMSDARVPFGNPSAALSATAFAEMPGVQSAFSPIEPYWELNDPTTPADDQLVFGWFTDLQAMKKPQFAGPTYPSLTIDTQRPPGEPPPGEVWPVFVDADGDGIADSLQVDAKDLGFSDAQLAALRARLNPPTNPTGKVFVGIRVIPHGGLVNLNASHPKLIENVLDVPPLYPPGSPPNPEYGNFYHRPTQNQVTYSPLLEESTLRRRILLPSRNMPPSLLQGDPWLDPVKYPNGKADMQWQLFAPLHGGAASGKYESVFNHRFSPYSPSEPFPGYPEYSYWAVRMEPFASAVASPGSPSVPLPDYDRRHLVTTVSHDDLLARGGRVANPAVPGGDEDILAKMTQANQTAWHSELCPALLPFEYADYPQTIPNENDCCPTDFGANCKPNARKGRLQLSLPWLDDQIDAANKLTDPKLKQEALDRIVHLIHDTFFLLVRNAAHLTTLEGTPCVSDADCTYANGVCGPIVPNRGRLCSVGASPVAFDDCATKGCSIPGSVCHTRTDDPYYRMCTIQAPYWQDIPCDAAHPTACDVAPGEICNTTLALCVDAWTHQTHSQALISRTAAALTANLIDYADADADDIPTRIALRSFDFTRGVCTKGTAGLVCDKDTDCGAGGVCSLGANSAGREFNFVPAPNKQFQYVYGLERQPYITEVATSTDGDGRVMAWAVELFNPYTSEIDLKTSSYFLYQVPPIGPAPAPVPLDAKMTTAKPFVAFVYDPTNVGLDAMLGDKPAGTVIQLPAGRTFEFKKDWTLYLVRQYTYLGDLSATEIVVDQFVVNGNVTGVDLPAGPGGVSTIERFVEPPTPANPASFWTATIPINATGPGVGESGIATLGTWNDAVNANLHPVEVNFANLDWFGRPFKNPANAADPRNGSVSFPTTGSLLMLMRHANRSFQDRIAPDLTVVKELAFTTHLIGDTTLKNPVSGVTLATILAEQQIDNGRMPVFDPPVRGTDNNWYAAHHVSPSATQLGAPGNLDTLPWGQLVFDYFTALPLSNPGPYVDIQPGPEVVVALPDSKPRVDLDGLRVHGRININAAPWKVLAGLPFIPMEKVPAPFKSRIRKTLGLVNKSAPDPPAPADFFVKDADAGTIGEHLAQAIVAYRELRPVGGSGNYADGTPLAVPPLPAAPIAYARGWNPTTPAPPPLPPVAVPLMARRGTGFMTVGELANVRHLGITDPLYRIDSGVIDPTNTNPPNRQNFVDAVAALVALGDWVTVRSQVFTVYGVLRGEDDQTVIDPDPSTPPTQAELRARDVDSRALRFQDTIDRLPSFLGAPVPSRIGDRTLTRYTDAHND